MEANKHITTIEVSTINTAGGERAGRSLQNVHKRNEYQQQEIRNKKHNMQKRDNHVFSPPGFCLEREENRDSHPGIGAASVHAVRQEGYWC